MQILHSFHAKLKSMHDFLRRLDLNLLLVFDALFRLRSVVLAADELSMSPSACSHALSRLRLALSDELFVRYGNAMQPTDTAEAMAGRVAEALTVLTETLSDTSTFQPATSTHTFSFAATDFTAFALLPDLVAKVEKQAPRIRINVVYSTHRESLDELAAGRIQFSLGFSDQGSQHSEGIQVLECFSDDYVVAARIGHPRVRKTLSLKQYLSERHVVVLPWQGSASVIDAALARDGHQRDVAIELPSVMAAPFIVANSELLVTLPRRAAERLSTAVRLSLYEAPFKTPEYMLTAFFHVRHASSASHRWMREQILAAFAPTNS
ncbi:TPA: LysR family transcriptional regulator [Burkholderia vietnamiensis]|nr:LysR family transcriptional regulator [Burkholderia vietnamiensis]